MSSEFWSAIAGALVAGLIGLGTQLLAIWEAQRARRDERDESRKALGLSLLFKMMWIHSNLSQLHGYVEEAFKKAKADGFEGEDWGVVRGFANAPEPVHFSADEMTLLLSLKDDKTFNDVLSMDKIHNGTLELLSVYGRRRDALTQMLPAEMQGEVGTITLNKEQHRLLAPRTVELNRLVRDIRQRLAQDSLEAGAALRRLHETLTKGLKWTYTLEGLDAAAAPANKTNAP